MSTIWEVIGTIIAIIGGIWTLIQISNWYGKRLNLKEERARERMARVKSQYYPHLISDFKDSLKSFKEGFLIGRSHSDTLFTVLRDYDHSSELRRVEKIDDTLYKQFRIIIDEIYPEIVKVDKLRIKARREIERAWVDYINRLREDKIIFLRPERVSQFVNELSSSFYWTLCRGEIEQAREAFLMIKDRTRLFNTYGGTRLIPENFFENIVELFRDNWVDITDLHRNLNERLSLIIEESILRKMEEDMNF